MVNLTGGNGCAGDDKMCAGAHKHIDLSATGCRVECDEVAGFHVLHFSCVP